MIDVPVLFPFVAAMSLAAATLVSEDLTCVAAGILVAEGTLPFPAAVSGCLAGIVLGDVVLMLAGKLLGRRAIENRWIRRLVTPAAFDGAARWMRGRGGAVVFVTRFLPGTRLATYLAAGVLGMSVRWFALCAAASALIWVPAVVGLAALGGHAVESQLLATTSTAARFAIVLAGVAAAIAGLRPDRRSIWRTGRRLYGVWQRVSRWEFWPAWLFYLPVAGCIGCLMIKHRGATVFTAANPGIPGGGFVGESKFDILRRLGRDNAAVARTALIPAGPPAAERAAMSLAFMDRAGLAFPIVLKPDQGQRGSGVVIVRSRARLLEHFATSPVDLLVQEYVPGVEFGVFYYRCPGAGRGTIFSMTEKRFPFVSGDGRRTIGDLILADNRAVCLAHVHRRTHAGQLERVPGPAERVTLVELGSHCRGSLFLDGSHLESPALADAIDAAAQRFSGFHFGRFDVRAATVEDFVAGSFRVIELNGVTSEATHIYDPGTPLLHADLTLFRQWQIAFDIGAANRRRGNVPATAGELLGHALRYRRLARMHPAQVGP